jgi:hypothetical protein
MKTRIMLLSLMAATVSFAEEPSVASLTSQIDDLKKRLTLVEELLAPKIALLQKVKADKEMNEDEKAVAKDSIISGIDPYTGDDLSPIADDTSSAAKKPSKTGKNSVPTKTLEGIKSTAQKMFPDDFNTQEYYINQQVNSWKRLHGKE